MQPLSEREYILLNACSLMTMFGRLMAHYFPSHWFQPCNFLAQRCPNPLGVRDFDVQTILVDPGNSIDLLQMSTYRKMGYSSSALENLSRIFDQIQWNINSLLGRYHPSRPGRVSHLKCSILSSGGLITIQRYYKMGMTTQNESHSFHISSNGELSH